MMWLYRLPEAHGERQRSCYAHIWMRFGSIIARESSRVGGTGRRVFRFRPIVRRPLRTGRSRCGVLSSAPVSNRVLALPVCELSFLLLGPTPDPGVTQTRMAEVRRQKAAAPTGPVGGRRETESSQQFGESRCVRRGPTRCPDVVVPRCFCRCWNH